MCGKSPRRGLTACLLAIVWLAGRPAALGAQGCADYAGTTNWLSEVPANLGYSAMWIAVPHHALAARGDTLYLADWHGELEIFAAADPTDLRRIGWADLGIRQRIGDIALAGNRAYLAGIDSLWVVSLADPVAPTVVRAIPSPVEARTTVMSDSTLVVAGRGGLWLVDISRPDDPTPLARLTLPAEVYAADCAAGIAHVATAAGLFCVDLRVPAAPAILAQFADAGSLQSVVVRHGLVYAGAWNDRGLLDLVMIDVHDPLAPQSLGRVADAGGTEFALDGAYLCASSWQGLVVDDVSNPLTPRLLWKARNEQMAGGGLVIRGGCLFAAQYPWDVTETRPALRSFVLGGLEAVAPARSRPWPEPTDWIRGGHLAGGRYGYFWTIDLDFQQEERPWWVVDLADPAAPLYLGELPTIEGSWALGGDHFYVAGDQFQVVDVSAPAQPRIVTTDPAPWTGHLRSDGSHPFVEVLGDTAGVFWQDEAGGYSRTIVNIAAPAAPRFESTTPVPAALQYWRLARLGNLGYVTSRDSLLTYDLADPEAPVLVDSTAMDGWNVFEPPLISGRHAYLPIHTMTNESALCVFDLSDPRRPRLAGRVPIPCGEHLLASGGLLVIHGGGLGVHVFDISRPPVPVYRGALTWERGTYAQWFVNGSLMVFQWGELQAYPLPCAAPVPVFLAGFRATAGAGGVALTWEVNGAAGEFRLTGGRGDETWPVAVAAAGASVFTAHDDAPALAAGGAIAYTLEHRAAPGGPWELLAWQSVELAAPPRAVALLAPHPNPFNPVVRLPFVLARAQRVRVAVYDLAGRCVAVLAEGQFAAGRQELVWRGLDARGAAVASGSYVVRVEGEAGRDGRRVTLLR